MYFTPNDSGNISLEWPDSGVAHGDNLIVRAARLLQSACEGRPGADIRIKKRLPMGGGIGGGSSNAATTLVALNHLWDAGLTDDELAELGLQLGADVPVFVRGQSAWAEGVGEHLVPIDVPEQYYLVAFPDTPVTTASVFGDPTLPRSTPEQTIQDYLQSPESFGNDCENLVFDKYPRIRDCAIELSKIGKTCLTGTGSSLFLALGDNPQIIDEEKKKQLRMNFVVTKARNLSPLFVRIRALRC